MVKFDHLNLQFTYKNNPNFSLEILVTVYFSYSGRFRYTLVATLNLHLPLPVHMKYISTFNRSYLKGWLTFET